LLVGIDTNVLRNVASQVVQVMYDTAWGKDQLTFTAIYIYTAQSPETKLMW